MSEMNWKNHPDWEDLVLALRSFQQVSHLPLIQIIVRLNHLFQPGNDSNSVLRKLKFLECDLLALKTEPGSLARLRCLNEFFFEFKKFAITPQTHLEESDFLLDSLLQKKRGMGRLIGLLYQHLAHQIDLKIDFVEVQNCHLLRWTHQSGREILNLEKSGLPLHEQEVLHIIQSQGTQKLEGHDEKSFLLSFLNELALTYYASEQWDLVRKAYDCILELMPNHLLTLGRRALLCYRLNQHEDSLADLKRYFAFAGPQNAPADLVKVFQQLTMQNASSTSPSPVVLKLVES